jgi:hypothetical protein
MKKEERNGDRILFRDCPFGIRLCHQEMQLLSVYLPVFPIDNA